MDHKPKNSVLEITIMYLLILALLTIIGYTIFNNH